ncbi:hypothetical protein ACEQ8H_001819 [Pleosporales sp. CAS-2024a]
MHPRISRDGNTKVNCEGCAKEYLGNLARREMWKKSPQCERLVAHLEQHGKEMRKINKIIICNVGPIDESSAFLQYTAADTIREVLHKEQQGGPFIEIVIQYHESRTLKGDVLCESCKSILHCTHDIDHWTQDNGDLVWDEETMLFAPRNGDLAPKNFLDMKNLPKGPAAILCYKILSPEAQGSTTQRFLKDATSEKLYRWSQECIADGRYLALDDGVDGLTATRKGGDLDTFGWEAGGRGAWFYWSRKA